MRRVMDPDEFAPWLEMFLPEIPNNGRTEWLRPVSSPDRADGKLAHLDGLNLSRAWMLRGPARSLPAGDPRIAALHASAEEHARVGLAAISADEYAGAHWLPSFATYLLTDAGAPAQSV